MKSKFYFFKSSRKSECNVSVNIFTTDVIKAYVLCKSYFKHHNIKGRPVFAV